jgi:hypothetical protein
MPPKAPRDIVSGHVLLRRLSTLVSEIGLDRRDLVVFGSGPLLVHGLRQQIRDLDVVARGRTWERVRQCGAPAVGSLNGAPMATFADGKIEFSGGWVAGDWNVDELIDRAEEIEGLRFARLDDVVRYKRVLDRPKDRADIRAIEQARAAPRRSGHGPVAASTCGPTSARSEP